MSHSLLRRCFLTLVVLGISMGTPAASASTLTWGSILMEGRNAWTWIGDVLIDQHQAGRTSKKRHGCGTGSNGGPRCQDPATVPTGKAGCTINPDGQPRCAP